MVGDAAEDAGALEGAKRLFARMGRVASKEERDPEDSHASQNGGGRTRSDGGRHIYMVDKVPFTIVFDGAEAVSVKVHMHGSQGGLQKPENRIVGRIVKVTASDDMVDADGRERIHQEPEPLHGNAPSWFRLGCATVLGRMVVYQYGECSDISSRTVNILNRTVVMPDPDRASVLFREIPGQAGNDGRLPPKHTH